MTATTIADDLKPLHHPKTWIGKYVWSQDHKVIAIQYILTAITIGLVALVLSALMRLQLGFPGVFPWIQPENYLQFVSLHGMIMVIYLLTALLLGGFGNYLIPLMVGARDMVFPFVNMLSYWVYLLSVLVLVSSFFVPGGPTGAGWTLYPPQAISERDAGPSMGHRPHAGQPRHIHHRLHHGWPQLYCDSAAGANQGHDADAHAAFGLGNFHCHHHGAAGFSGAVRGGDHDAVRSSAGHQLLHARHAIHGSDEREQSAVARYCSSTCSGSSAIPRSISSRWPAFGIVSDLISVHARKNIFGYRMMVWAIVIIGALSFVVWAHHMYVSGMNPYFGFFFATSTLVIAIPTAIKVYNWLLTLWRGDIHLRVPMLFAVAFILTFIHGGLSGLFLGNVIVDVPLSDTMFVVGHFHMVMGVSPILVIFGAIYHWYPKITGRMWHDGLAKLHFWITFLGVYAIYVPMHYIGILGVPRRYYALGETAFIPDSVNLVNQGITVAALLVFVAQGLFFYNMIWSLFRGPKADTNPWGAASLEWQTPETPPSHGNWGPKLQTVYRWAYDYSVPGAPRDFIPQNEPPS